MNHLFKVHEAGRRLVEEPVVSPALLSIAVHLLKERALRKAAFPEIEFVDTEWFTLLELFVAAATDHRLSLSDLYYVADVPKSTAIRVIDRLVRSGVLCRDQDPSDGRRTLVRLRDETQARLNTLLIEMHRTAAGDTEPGRIDRS